MRWHCIVALVALCFTVPAVASLDELAEVLPPCALECFGKVLPQSPCNTTEPVCMCTNAEFTSAVEVCVAGSCTIRESLTTKNITSTACGAPIRDRTKLVSGFGLGGGAIALLAYILRIIARLPCCGGEFGMDDLVMTLTMMLVIPLSALSYVLAEDGLGKDIWTVPFENITHILYVYFYDELLYLTAIALTKISILFFYLRVFPRRAFRIAVYVAIGLNVGYIIAFDLVSIFQCRPLPGAWLRWDGEGDYQCNNINAQGWTSAGLNMVLDIIVMALPLRELYQLNLSVRKKIYVMCMFSLGIFVTIISIIRLQAMIHFAATHNITWDYVAIGYWSTIEAHVGIICACLPAIRALMRRIFPRVFGDTSYGVSKHSISRSMGNSSRIEGGTIGSVRPKYADDQFVPLVDIETSSQANLTGRGNSAYTGTKTWVES